MTREDLKKYKYKQKWIKAQLEFYEEQKSLVEKITTTIDGLPKTQNKPSYQLEALMDRFNVIISMINEEQDKLDSLIKQIQQLEEPYNLILFDIYILGKTIAETSADINYAYNRTCSMHGKALNIFDEINKNF